VARRRQAWFDGQPELDPERLIVSAESGATTTMARLRGRARCGERCRAAVPHGHWKTTTFVGGLRLSGMTAPMGLDGPMNGPAFRAYVELGLAPTLAPGEPVVMDTLPAHKIAPQDRRRADGYRGHGRAAAPAAALQPRLQPDRARFRQAQSPAPPSGCPHHSRALGRHRRSLANLLPQRMRQLLHRLRL
jgi:hypothetical protein